MRSMQASPEAAAKAPWTTNIERVPAYIPNDAYLRGCDFANSPHWTSQPTIHGAVGSIQTSQEFYATKEDVFEAAHIQPLVPKGSASTVSAVGINLAGEINASHTTNEIRFQSGCRPIAGQTPRPKRFVGLSCLLRELAYNTQQKIQPRWTQVRPSRMCGCPCYLR